MARNEMIEGLMNRDERALLQKIQLYGFFPRSQRARTSTPSFLALLPPELIDERLIPYLAFEPKPLKTRQHGGVYDNCGRLILPATEKSVSFRIKELGHRDMLLTQWLHERLYLL
jgi:hypothetical protein